MSKMFYFLGVFILVAQGAAALPDASITFEMLDVTKAHKEKIFKAKQKKTYDKYRRVMQARSVGRFSSEDIRNCELEEGMVISRYGRDACSIHTTDANKACNAKEDCQSSCLAVIENNTIAHGLSAEPTQLRHKPGRCASHLHLIGCVTLSNQETKCFNQNKPVKGVAPYRP